MRLHLTASFLKLNIPTPFFMYLFFVLFILINFKFGNEKNSHKYVASNKTETQIVEQVFNS